MSCGCYVKVVLGVKIAREKIFVPTTVPSCECDIENRGAIIFCPKCGKKVGTKIEEVPIPSYVGECEGDDDENIGGYGVFWDESHDSEEAFVGELLRKSDDLMYNPLSQQIVVPDDPERFKARIKEKLNPLELWNEKEYGIWLVYFVG